VGKEGAGNCILIILKSYQSTDGGLTKWAYGKKYTCKRSWNR